MPVETGHRGLLKFRKYLSTGTPDTFSTLAIYDWTMSWGSRNKVEYWSYGDGLSHSLPGLLWGTVSFNARGCDPDSRLVDSSSNTYPKGVLEFNLQTNATTYYRVYVRPRKVTFNWDYSGVSVPTQTFSGEYDIVWYEPEAVALAYADPPISCDPVSACTLIPIKLDNVAMTNVINASLSFEISEYPHYFTYSPIAGKTIKGSQHNSGNLHATLQIGVHDDGHTYTQGLVREVELYTDATKKWGIKWFMFDHRSNLVVNRRTNNIKSCSLHFTHHGWRSDDAVTVLPARGAISLPNGTVL